MELTSRTFEDGERGPDAVALAVPHPDDHVTFSTNRNPHLAWTAVDGASSYVVTCIDPDCPSAPDDVNQTDREVPADLPRIDFVHWLLADIPSTTHEISEGSHSDGVVERGKGADATPVGIPGRNDYSAWFEGDEGLEGLWLGYDGPAPPWNDSIEHRYIFSVKALDIASTGLPPGFTRDDLDSAIDGHVIDEASLTLTYTTNQRLR